MVQFLSIFFFLDFFNFCWVFQKFPFFCHPVFEHISGLPTVDLIGLFRIDVCQDLSKHGLERFTVTVLIGRGRRCSEMCNSNGFVTSELSV